MYSPDKFEFTTVVPTGTRVTIDGSIGRKEQLLKRLAHGFAFPDYFGGNWDALIDCLSDLSWMQAPEAIIDHEDVPPLPPSDLRLYLESLIDAADRRTSDRLPKLRIVFRLKDRARVASALGAT